MQLQWSQLPVCAKAPIVAKFEPLKAGLCSRRRDGCTDGAQQGPPFPPSTLLASELGRGDSPHSTLRVLGSMQDLPSERSWPETLPGMTEASQSWEFLSDLCTFQSQLSLIFLSCAGLLQPFFPLPHSLFTFASLNICPSPPTIFSPALSPVPFPFFCFADPLLTNLLPSHPPKIEDVT